MRLSRKLAAGLAAALACALTAQQAPYTFAANSGLVLVNLTVRDKSGAIVRDITPADLTLLEDGRPQRIAGMELEDLDKGVGSSVAADTPSVDPEIYRDRRLIVLFFDWTAMPAFAANTNGSAQASTDWGLEFVRTQMRAADLVEVAALGDQLEVAQAFTSDKDALQAAIQSMRDQAMRNAAPYRADPERSLIALRALCRALGAGQQRKSLVLFSSLLTGSHYGLRSAEAAALAANVVIYPWDAAGLEGAPPEARGGNGRGGRGGGANAGPGGGRNGAGGDGEPAGASLMTELANATGGVTLFSANNPAPLFARLHDDTASYYLISYVTTNPAFDGRLRQIAITARRPGLDLAYRQRYTGPKDFAHLDGEERKAQLADEAIADDPEQSLTLGLHPTLTPAANRRYRLSVQVELASAEKPERAAVDVVVMVYNSDGVESGEVSGSIKPGPAREFTAQLELAAPGRYRIRVAAREDLAGKLGAAAVEIVAR